MNTTGPTAIEHAAGFHDAECAPYRADLPWWQELAEETGGPILDLGAGTGRVTLPLAAQGHDVTAVDIEPLLLEELGHRASLLGLTVPVVVADITDLSAADALPPHAALAMIPMQSIQLLGGREGRRGLLRTLHPRCRPGAVLAVAVVPEVEAFDGRDASPMLLPPDIARVGEWRFHSTPLAVLQESPQAPIHMHRRREIRTASGDPVGSAVDVVITLDPVSPAGLDAEAIACGWEPEAAEVMPATDEHAGGLILRFRRSAEELAR